MALLRFLDVDVAEVDLVVSFSSASVVTAPVDPAGLESLKLSGGNSLGRLLEETAKERRERPALLPRTDWLAIPPSWWADRDALLRN